MSSTTSGSIDIHGSPYDQDKVSRTMPAILTGRITSADWTTLCNDLDKALKSSAGVKKLTFAWGLIEALVFIIFLMFGFLGFASGENRFQWSFFVVAILIAIVGNLFIVVILTMQRNKIKNQLTEVCDKASTSHPGVSFHVRYEMRRGRQNSCDGGERDSNNDCDCNNERGRDHIEVYVSPIVANSALYTPSSPPVAVEVAEAYVVPPSITSSSVTAMPSAPPKASVIYPYDDPEMAFPKEKRSSTERMKELDRMRHIITEEEYYRKRAEILSDI